MTAGSAPRRKAVHVSTVHPATDVRVFHKQCRSLAAAGYDVVLHARADHGYVEDGVRVVPVPTARSRWSRMTVGVWSLLPKLLAHRADVYHFHDPELVPLGVAMRLLGRRTVFDAHEPLPSQVMGKHWIPGPLRPLVSGAARLLVWLAGRGLSAVVAASPVAADDYARARRVVVVNNYPILDDRPAGTEHGAAAGTGAAADIPYAERPGGLVYVGAITELRGLDAMLEVARVVHQRHGVKLTLIGPFQPPELEARLAEPGIAEAVEYVGVKRPAEARALVGASKVGLMLQIGPKAYENNPPTKIFEYMAEGVPVVASHFPLWKQIVSDAGAGVVVPPEDAAAAADAVSRLLAEPEEAAAMGERGRKVAREQYSWETEVRSLLALYDDLLAKNEPAVAR